MSDYAVTDAMGGRERSLVNAIKRLLEMPDVDTLHRRQLIDTALWKYTEASGMSPHPKYNLRYVSDGARNLESEASLNHEHVWSRRWLLDKLLGRSSWDTAGLSEFLHEHAVACVVTVAEHGLLADQPGNGWRRYAGAGISVWDRQQQGHLDLESGHPLAAPRTTSPPQPSLVNRFDLNDLIDDRAGARAGYLKRLIRMARFSNAVSVVALKQNGEPADYFRIHDTRLDEPTRAVAYPHWSGKVDFALQASDVPATLMSEPSVKELQKKTYAVSCTVADDSSVEVAEELLFLSLEKLRGKELTL